jgi:hypothetical protein
VDCDLPSPECAAFLVCREILDDKKFGDVVRVGQAKSYQAQFFPAAVPVGFFIRLTEARGEYIVEVQLRDAEGEVVWRDRRPSPWSLPNSLAARPKRDLRAALRDPTLKLAVVTWVGSLSAHCGRRVAVVVFAVIIRREPGGSVQVTALD